MYLCHGFIPCDDKDKSCDLVAGGSNGVVYLFRKAVCSAFAQVLRGKVTCLEVATGSHLGELGRGFICLFCMISIITTYPPLCVSADCKVVCGGAGGVLKVLDGRTLAVLQSHSLLDSAAVPRNINRPGSAARPRSASSGRTGSAARAPLAAPKQLLQVVAYY